MGNASCEVSSGGYVPSISGVTDPRGAPRIGRLKQFVHMLSLHHRPRAVRGFILVVTISLMVLLTVIAVGLLSLSAASLRASSQESAKAQARANARLALMLAIGELQVELGPDRRVNCQAGIDRGSLPAHRNWLAVYDAWNAADRDRPEPGDRFRKYLVSGDLQFLRSRDAAKSAITGDSIALVAEGTLGNQAADGVVSAGLVPLLDPENGKAGDFGWWIGDNNVKAMVNAGLDVLPEVSGELLAQHSAQSASGTGYQLVDSLAGVNGAGRAGWELGDDLRMKSLSLSSISLLPGASPDVGKHFHDITQSATGLLVDVRNGGLKRDLSLYLQQEMSPSFRRRLRQPLYSVPSGGAQVNFSPDSAESGRWDNLNEFTGITMEELWLYYNLHKEVIFNRPASSDPRIGVVPGGYPTLVSANSRDGVIRDPFYLYKREVYSQVKYILSLAAAPSSTRDRHDLRISVDPVVVLWNPNNVAVEYQVGGFTTVGFSALPYECVFEVTGPTGNRTFGPVQFNSFFGGVNGIQAQVGKAHKIILRPGESRVFSPMADKSQGLSVTIDVESGWDFTTGAIFNSANFPKALAAGDRIKVTLRPNILTPSSDYITYWFGPRTPSPALQSGTISLQHDMTIGRDLPTVVTPQAYSVSNIVAEGKIPMMLFSYYMRPERDTDTPSKPWIWNNPAIMYRWPADGSLSSKLHRQLEMKVLGLDAWENPYVQVTPENQAYWGGGVRADFGVPFFTFRSVPLTPPLSIAALQHACANGFRRHWKDSPIATGGGRFPADAFSLDGHQYLAPMVSKAIGNSFAQPLIPGNRVDGSLFAFLGPGNGGRSANYNIADHSYLANAALWDTWYFSSLTPQTMAPYRPNTRTLQQVFDDFFPASAAGQSVPLPSVRMRPYQSGDETELRKLVRNGKPTEDAYRKLARHLTVDGAFNVNSISVDAWKAILGSLRGHDALRRDRTATRLSLESASADETPVNGLLIANGPRAIPSGNLQEPDQWTGYRTLGDDEIDRLAMALVDEIHLRGPFLCLSDFINRRPGSNGDLARQGTLQAAIEKSGINGNLDDVGRAVGSITGAPFPEAGKGSRASGIPGFITQADLLTPLGPSLQARSDSFTIRAYGQATDRNGGVVARAWCEATVQRVPEYLDPADAPDVRHLDLESPVNRSFGRQFRVTGFRWLNSEEI
jgi:hypothetical protein